MWLVRLALGNIYGVIVMALFIVVLGVVAMLSIPVDILPAFRTPAVQVLTYFPGMPAASVEKTLTNRIERWVNQSPGVLNVESRSLPGVSITRVFFRDEVDPTAALTMTNSLALGTLPFLPPNTLAPVVLPFDPTGTLPLGILTVSNPHMDEAGVKDIARIQVRALLGRVKGSVAPTVVGGKDRTILIYLDPKKLQSRNLSATDVVKTLQDGNLMVTPGTAYFGDNQVLLDTNAMVANVQDLNDLPLRMASGEVITLGDIGNAEDASAIQTSRVRIYGKQQVYVPIYRQGGASSLKVAEDIKREIPDIEERLPQGTKLDYVVDQSEYVRGSIESLIHEGVIGAILVAVMILLFLGNARMTFIAVLSLPLAILGAIVGLQATGNTINVMTLGGMFLAIGPLVDEAIVVLENTHRHLEWGKSSEEAALDGTAEVSLPVMIAAITTVLVLCPIGLMPGLGGFLFRPLLLAVGFAMFTSFLLSRSLVPGLCAKLLAQRDAKSHDLAEPSKSFFGWLHGYFDSFLNLLNRGYVGLLEHALRHRALVLCAVGLALAASFLLLGSIGQEFFPQVDAGQISLAVRAPSNTRLDATERRVMEVEHLIETIVPPLERRMIVSEIGLNSDWSSAYTQNAGQQDALLRVQLTPERAHSAQEYAIKLRHALLADGRFSDLQFSFDTGGMVMAALNFGASSPIDIQIEAPTQEQAMDLARALRNLSARVKGTADVRVQQRLDAPYLVLDVKRQKAAEVGLTARDVILQVVAAMNSSTSITRNFWIDLKSGNQYYVAVQYPEDPERRLEDLQNVFATGTNQSSPVSLSSLVELHSSTAPVEINHSMLQRVTNVLINTENRDTGSVAADIRERLKRFPVPKGCRVELKGEFARMNDSFRTLGFGMVLSATLVYLLMVPLFRSFVGPLIIMCTVPLGLIGVLTMLWLTGTTLNVQSVMGVIFLIGIVVSNGVLLLDFANQLRRRGATPGEAIRQAARLRFRPILMTFLATFLDLIPMALGLGRGSEALTPLARAVVGGLLTSTLLTLIVVPVLYTLLIREPRPASA